MTLEVLQNTFGGTLGDTFWVDWFGVVLVHFEGNLGHFGFTLGLLWVYFEGTLRVVRVHYEGLSGSLGGTLGSL